MPAVYRTLQLTLDDARRPHGRGGWRPRAGRPRGRICVPHTTRERFAARHPSTACRRCGASRSL